MLHDMSPYGPKLLFVFQVADDGRLGISAKEPSNHKLVFNEFNTPREWCYTILIYYESRGPKLRILFKMADGGHLEISITEPRIAKLATLMCSTTWKIYV